MSQQNEVRRKEDAQRQAAAASTRQRQQHYLSSHIRALVLVMAVIDIFVLGALAVSRATELFAVVFIPIVMTYLFGSLYLFKELLHPNDASP